METNEIYGTCSCCGAGIKHIVRIDGKTYGQTCASRLLGTNLLVVRDGVVDVQATKDGEAKRQLTRDERVAKIRADMDAGQARFALIQASPVANAMVAHFNHSNNRPSRFIASVLCSLLFDYGSVSEKQLAAVAKTLGLQITDADLALTQRFKGDMVWHHSKTSYANGVSTETEPELFTLFAKHNASQHKMFELLGIN